MARPTALNLRATLPFLTSFYKGGSEGPPRPAGTRREGMAAAESSARWGSSTNWIVAEGSLHGSISFETSADDGPEAIPGGVLLLKPTSNDSEPCEITVTFREKHDIHNIYIRSTARIYEIYLASDQQNNSKEYLCTVRCGATAIEGTIEATSPSVNVGVTTESQKGNNGTMEASGQIIQGDSNSSSSDEDGWVEVKVPASHVRDDQVNTSSKRVAESSSNQIHYEATAKISDASPCVSLTLRLLSLQTKTCVHVEEMYIYADPIEPSNPDSRGSLGGTSLLAMLVPNLLQLSKSGAIRIHDRCISDDSRVQCSQISVVDAAETRSSGTGSSTMLQEAYCTIPDEELRLVQEPSEVQEVQLENALLGSIQKEGASHQAPEPVIAENNLAYSRVEKLLNELVSRVGRVEAFCSRFEEKMMKPFGCIEARLQRFEQQLDAFVVRSQFSERIPCPRFSAPRFSCDESDAENKHCNPSYTQRGDTSFHDPSSPADDLTALVPESHTCIGLIVKAPEFLSEDDELTNSGDTSGSMAMGCSNDNDSVSITGAFTSVPESHMRQGLSVKAPEFLNEDDECINSYDTLDSVVKDLPGDKKPLSIDGALASALAAFLASTSIKSANRTPSLMAVAHESCNDASSDLAPSIVGTPSEEGEYLLTKSALENNARNIMDTARKGTDLGELLNLAADVEAPENLFDESDIENKDCNVSVSVKKATTFDESLLSADDVTSPVFASQTHSGLIVIAPEFPIKDGGFIGCDDTSDSHVRDFPEDQAASPTDGGSVSALALFLSSMMVKSSSCCPALQSCSSELSSSDNYVLASSSIGILCEGDGYSGIANHGHDTTGKVDLDLVFKPCPTGSFEQNDEDSLEQEDYGMNWHERKQDQPPSTGVGSNVSTNHNWHGGGCADDDDSEEVVHGDPSLNPRGRGWAENSSSTDSGFDGNSITDRVPIEWSDGSSTDSDWGPFMVDQSYGQAADDCRSTQESAKSHCGITGRAGYSREKSKVEIEQALNLAEDYQDPVLDCPVRYWTSGLPLEVLLGETSITIDSGEVEVLEDRIAAGNQFDISVVVDLPLLEVEGLTPLLTEPSSCLGGDVVGTEEPGSSSQQRFSSLI